MFKKVDSKISLAIIVASMLIVLIQGGLILGKVNAVLEHDMEQLVETTAKEKTNLIEQKITRAVGISNDISSIVVGVVDPEELTKKGDEYEKILDPIIKKIILDNIDQVMGAYLILDPEESDRTYGVYYEDVDNNGVLVEKEKYDISLFREKSERVQWYYDCVGVKEGVWYEPYFSNHNQVEMISFTKPIYKDEVYVGLLSIDLNFQVIKDFVNEIELMNSGYVFIVNEADNFVVHRSFTVEDNLSTIGEGDYARLKEDVDTLNEKTDKYMIDGLEKHLSFSKLSNGWAVCSVIGRDSLVASNWEIIRIMCIIAGVSIVVSVILSRVFCYKIGHAITYVTSALNQLADLNLTVQEKEAKFEQKFTKKDQIGIMVTSLSSLRSHLVNIIPKLKIESKDTLNFSKHLTESVKQSSNAMEAISVIMDQVADGSEKQVQEAEFGVERLNSLATMIEESIVQTRDVNDYLSRTSIQNEKNMQHMKNLSDKFKITQKNTGEVGDNIHLLSKKSQDIGNIVTTIKSIADQTNLLALNATIEAARAGEHGKGFVVVAEEIKNLSEETTEATNEIAHIIQEICDKIEETEQGMQEGEAALSESSFAMEETSTSFTTIAQDIKNMVSVTKELIHNITQINTDKEEVIRAMDHILEASKENGHNVDEILPSIEQEQAVLKEMKEISSKLKVLSENLDTISESFVTE